MFVQLMTFWPFSLGAFTPYFILFHISSLFKAEFCENYDRRKRHPVGPPYYLSSSLLRANWVMGTIPSRRTSPNRGKTKALSTSAGSIMGKWSLGSSRPRPRLGRSALSAPPTKRTTTKQATNRVPQQGSEADTNSELRSFPFLCKVEEIRNRTLPLLLALTLMLTLMLAFRAFGSSGVRNRLLRL